MLYEHLAQFGLQGNPFTASSEFFVGPVWYWIALLITVFLLGAAIVFGLMYYFGTRNDIREFSKYFIKKPMKRRRNDRWERIRSLFMSQNPSDWRMGIIEADTMLESLLDDMGYEGQSVGERLKQIEQSDFPTLQYAWEAHKVRNRIAHEGTSYQLSHQQATRVFKLFQFVFEDARYI